MPLLGFKGKTAVETYHHTVCPDTDTCYYIEAAGDAASATLRLTEAANGQKVNVRRAELLTVTPLAP
ncbi:hypothetical protein HY251_15740 [bacterium]|nr:hypothetical protein [bacterium]